MDYNISNRQDFFSAFKKICLNYGFTENKNSSFISTKNGNGKYSLEFTNSHLPYVFNKIATTLKLLKSKYYPKTFLIKNQKEFDNLKLENKYYFVKPQFGWECKNISLLHNKNFIFNKGIKFPLIIQEEILPKLYNNTKEDYRIYVLYVKNNNQITSYYYPIGIKRKCSHKFNNQRTEENSLSISNNSHKEIFNANIPKLKECLKETQSHIIPKLNNKNKKELEISFLGYDLIQDKNGKFWILEINSVPSFFHKPEFIKFQSELIQDILFMILHYNLHKTIIFNNFIKLS